MRPISRCGCPKPERGLSTAALLGVDLGGTHVRALVIEPENLRILARADRPTPRSSADAIVGAILEACAAALAGARLSVAQLAAVGCAAPGPLDHRSGTIHFAPNLAGFNEMPLGPRLSEALGTRVFLDRDTSAALIGEVLAGAGQGTRDAAYITVSTGLGGAILSDGRMIRGAANTAGEIGHWPVALSGSAGVPRCGCGALGCAEAYAGGRNLASRFGVVDAAEVYRAARSGDARAAALVADAADALGSLAVGLVNVLSPEKIIVGGAVASHQPAHVLEPMRRAIAARAFKVAAARVAVIPAALGDDVGPIGAALAARERAEGRGEWFR